MRFIAVASIMLLATALPVDAAQTDTVCKETERKVVQGVVISTDTDCHVQADVRIQECVWGGYWDTTTAGPLTVRVYKCSPPQAQADVLGPCPSEKQLGVGTLYLDQDCAARLDIKFYDCIWGGHWDEYGTDAAKVRVYSCDPYPPTGADARPCPAHSGSSWVVSFETRSDCTGWVYLGDSYRLCTALGMRPAGSTVQSVGPLTVGAMNCALY